MISQIRPSKIHKSAVSVRLDDDLLEYVRSKNLNLSSTLNHLLRGYLYIQSVDNTIVFERSNVAVPNGIDIHIDVYSSISEL